MNKETFLKYVAAAEAAPVYQFEVAALSEAIPGIYGPVAIPISTPTEKTVGAGYVIKVHDPVKGEDFAVTVAAYRLASDDIQYSLRCPSSVLLQGTLGLPSINAMISQFVCDAQYITATAAASALHGACKHNGSCSFTALLRAGQLCEHTKFALKALVAAEPDFVKSMDDALNKLQGVTPTEATPAPTGLQRYAFKVPVLLEGDRGSGKTYGVYELSRSMKVPLVLLAGHEGVEPADMLGYTVQAGSHGFVWMDGPVTAAFRRATKERTVLLIDELLRIPQRQLSFLLTALTPDETDGVFRLNTGRALEVVDGVGQFETITCPIDNLAVFATTNIGGEYAVDDCDPALRERFQVIRCDTDEAKLEEILRNMISARGFSGAAHGQLMKFFIGARTLHEQGQLHAAPTMRTMTRAVRLAEHEMALPGELFAARLQWVARDLNGRPVVEQEELLRKLINRSFGANLQAPKARNVGGGQ